MTRNKRNPTVGEINIQTIGSSSTEFLEQRMNIDRNTLPMAILVAIDSFDDPIHFLGLQSRHLCRNLLFRPFVFLKGKKILVPTISAEDSDT